MAVRTKTVETASVEGGDARIEAALNKAGLKWTYIPDVPTTQFNAEKSARNQVRFLAVNEKRVDEYAEAMRRGDKFPPVVAYSERGQFVNADGNHRLRAAIKAEKNVTGVYDITGNDQTAITMYAYRANTRHGLPTGEEERVQQALWLIDNGATLAAAAHELSLPRNVLVKAQNLRNTNQRFKDNAIAPIVIEALGESTKWRLSAITTDEGFTAMTDLAYKARLTTEDTFKYVTEMNELKSSGKQVEYVETLAAELQGAIVETGGGVLARRQQSPKARANVVLGGVLNLPELSALTGYYQGAERAEAAKRFRDASRRLSEVAKALSS